MSKLAQLIAKIEGFYVPGSIPQRRNNPGDLRHSPHSSHEGIGANDIGGIATVEEGWADLERQLRLDASRGYTIKQLIESYAPPTENDTQGYLKFICAGLGLPETATVEEALNV